MFRKLALAAAAVVTLGAGMAAAPAPANAQFGFYFGSGGHHGYHHRPRFYGHGFYPRYRYYEPPPRRYCERVVVRKKINGKWRKVVERQCYPRRYRY
jgi:hypothetical protein